MISRESRIKKLLDQIDGLPERQIHWLERVVDILLSPHKFKNKLPKIMSESWTLSFGDALMIHHTFSNEPFTKDKFEHALVNTALLVGHRADFAPRGNRGHDVVIDENRVSLKTQADSGIKEDLIWISKYMELGKGDWTDKPIQLKALVHLFIDHLKKSDRILILRCLSKKPIWKYELVEIPKGLLMMAISGNIEMKTNSKQMPKPGYCTVSDRSGNLEFQLYFDGGSERKLQIKNLRKSSCQTIAEWAFETTSLM